MNCVTCKRDFEGSWTGDCPQCEQDAITKFVNAGTSEPAKPSSHQQEVQRHKWIIHYADERGQAHHHQTIFEDEVREIAAKALAAGMISLTVLRTLNPVPLNEKGQR